MTVELLGGDGQALDGYRPAVLTGDSVRHRAEFGRSPSELAGRPVRLRFTLEKASLYAFQFVP